MRKFYAKGRLLVADPTQGDPQPGQPRRYAGRTMKIVDGQATFPATEEGFTYDEQRPAIRDVDRRMLKRVRRDHDMWPADEVTAQACGVAFVPVVFKDGEFVPVEAPQPKAGGKSGGKPGKENS
ncbi:MAG: hypothetical protein AAF715_31625 [Myxococcota bacterium]